MRLSLTVDFKGLYALPACLLTPCLEEVLYRGVVYGRLCDLLLVNHEEQGAEQTQKAWKNRLIAMALSALLFGVLHQNLVQFVYAGALGLMLAWFMEEANAHNCQSCRSCGKHAPALLHPLKQSGFHPQHGNQVCPDMGQQRAIEMACLLHKPGEHKAQCSCIDKLHGYFDGANALFGQQQGKSCENSQEFALRRI